MSLRPAFVQFVKFATVGVISNGVLYALYVGLVIAGLQRSLL